MAIKVVLVLVMLKLTDFYMINLLLMICGIQSLKNMNVINMTFEDAYHQARLARILRKGEYDFATSKPKLWSFQYEHYRDTRQGKKAS